MEALKPCLRENCYTWFQTVADKNYSKEHLSMVHKYLGSASQMLILWLQLVYSVCLIHLSIRWFLIKQNANLVILTLLHKTEKLVTLRRQSIFQIAASWVRSKSVCRSIAQRSTDIDLCEVCSEENNSGTCFVCKSVSQDSCLQRTQFHPHSHSIAEVVFYSKELLYQLGNNQTMAFFLLLEKAKHLSGLAIYFMGLTWKTSSSVKRLFRASLTPLLLWFWTERK